MLIALALAPFLTVAGIVFAVGLCALIYARLVVWLIVSAIAAIGGVND